MLMEAAAKLEAAANEVANLDLSSEKEAAASFLSSLATSIASIGEALGNVADALSGAMSSEPSAPVDPAAPAGDGGEPAPA